MSKQRKWQSYLIIVVVALTVYNILPTLFFYTKPLKTPIDAQRSQTITREFLGRVNQLEEDATSWLASFCQLLHIKPLSSKIDPQHPEFITLSFSTLEEARLFRSKLPRAGALIPFVPAQLSLYDSEDLTSKEVIVQRKIGIHFDPNQLEQYTRFSLKFDPNHQPTPLYRSLIADRLLQVGVALAGSSENALMVQALSKQTEENEALDSATFLAEQIVSFAKVYGESSLTAARYFAGFSQLEISNRSAFIQQFIKDLEEIKNKVVARKQALVNPPQQQLDLLNAKEKLLQSALAIVKRNTKAFSAGRSPLTFASLTNALDKAPQTLQQTVSLEGRHPLIASLTIDWNNQELLLTPYEEVALLRSELDQDPSRSLLAQTADSLLYNQIATVSRQSGEQITPHQGAFKIQLSDLNDSPTFLALRLSGIAATQAAQIEETLKTAWHPTHPDLIHSTLPVYDYDTYRKLPVTEQQFALVVYAPAVHQGAIPQGFKTNSIYVIAKGLDKIIQRVNKQSPSETTYQFHHDTAGLRSLLQRHGFVGYSGRSYQLGTEFAQDIVFECPDYYQTVLKATREAFSVHGTKRYAVLEFTNVEQRLLTANQIDNRIHEDLLKWRDDYHAAQLGIRGVLKFDVPKPTRNVLWSNFKLSCLKYFRGDDRKILHWGLDLSGGKTVQIELRDTQGKRVTDAADIKQGINELYQRVNKMGVSEVSIRQEGNFIALDFPGSQGLSAAELVRASSMFFHIVNEKFGPHNRELKEAVDQFLQDIWNEALVTGRKQMDEINAIARRHLHGDGIESQSTDSQSVRPRSEAARLLYDQGLRLADPEQQSMNSTLDETFSTIRSFRGDDFTDWYGQTHPLLIVFNHFALEGSNLNHVQASYDPSKGNFLSFGVEGSGNTKHNLLSNPQEALFAWTSKYAKEKIAGTSLEAFSAGRGWRMAVVLNGSIISAPGLDSPLKDSAMITGSFTQREVSLLEADLKAGSLSFTPHILSEKNVSPELGSKERTRGIVATLLSLCLVITVMVGYYRFGGLVASVAVLFNLLIMWATLQNLQATMTLAGIAGIILTLAMAVDANVLVFERIREEFAATGRIATAVHNGYRKALSAILDSNMTTIIAAMILLHFDSGPIKALAIMLIIGILSSLFTALFMTRFFFQHWVKNPENKTLNMLHWFKSKDYNFLKHTKKTVVLSAILILLGGFVLVKERHTLFGMDFTGGYALNVELQPQDDVSYRAAVEQALLNQGATAQEFQVRELTPANHLRILLSHQLQQQGRPFFGLPLENDLKEPVYRYELNPRIVWTVDALSKASLSIAGDSLPTLDSHWTEVSGQMSDVMRNNALIGLSIALVCILCYISIRFEFKYAISATLCLAHDVIFTLAVLALLHACGVPVQIDLNTVAALMTIIGYSLNDTIIIFDRIREDVRSMRRSSFTEIINHALNVTLSRTLLTSGTTLLVLVPLIIMGGSTLFGFSLIMAIGIIFGTLSSLFIAAPLMKYFHDRQLQRDQRHTLSQRE